MSNKEKKQSKAIEIKHDGALSESGFGGARCMRKVYQRDEHGVKLKSLPRVRCKKAALKDTNYCERHTSGRKNIVHGKYSRFIPRTLGDTFDIFYSQANVQDLSEEMAILRTVLGKYLEVIQVDGYNRDQKDYAKDLKKIKSILKSKTYTPKERYERIKKFCLRHELANSDVLYELRQTIEGIGKTAERMNRIESSDKFTMNLQGIRLLITNIGYILNKYISDKDIIVGIRNELLQIPFKSSLANNKEVGFMEAQNKIIEMPKE